MTRPPRSVLRTPPAFPESALPAFVQKLDRPEALVKAQALAFLMFEKRDLRATQTFLTDFGMHCVSRTGSRLLMRGAGPQPCLMLATPGQRSRYVGAAFSVRSEADLDYLEANANARRLQADEIPGGGAGVELTDPAGNLLWLVTGQQPVDPLPLRDPLHSLTNDPGQLRRVNATVRPPLEPAAVVKLGHVVLQTVDFPGMARWYMRHLGLIPTDVQYLEDGSPNLCFFRLDLGSTPADHHAFVLAGGIEEKYEHSAYEVLDLDALGQGNNVLRANGHRHMWGIGRHVLGSQLFDYWFDPDGMEFEHYADGDVFTADRETHYVPLEMSGIWAWGDDVPAGMGVKRNLATVFRVARLLRAGRLSAARLKLLGRVMTQARPWL
ncbi:biphenyl-2,3-diol 1,2-dioxygenase BphC (plasmid) [Cupriavidus necator N-1]|jgi:catechol 2,3-dioxygenase-like lactoylglutathione lyase family enzyme|uniref:Biphenyl-2,3-diol 1,2-dioxygenase BphC n=1 Tax=Cupriavidus necator (strain ATCC 43291 / DSM 13513 / CCUG 52238 / LMG 8453 / N-1) TaxID=1042878 RepID=F8GWL0_CUPNN|nr:VOC family protein [Cupriavidus necator]AEI82818.1 biphenyl-2,3-diol 1,2-dioxygenase BphC [Cupriavidus necator N-1]MDX6007813.1 VOC family protein [Cupriavidus necator]